MNTEAPTAAAVATRPSVVQGELRALALAAAIWVGASLSGLPAFDAFGRRLARVTVGLGPSAATGMFGAVSGLAIAFGVAGAMALVWVLLARATVAAIDRNRRRARRIGTPSWFPFAVAGLAAVGVAARADAAHVPVRSGIYDDPVVLLDDPTTEMFGLRVEVRLGDGRRVLMSIPTEHASRARGWRTGDQVVVVGRLSPFDPGADDSFLSWVRSRHLTGRLTVDEVGAHRDAGWWWWPSEQLRSWVAEGARLTGDQAPLYAGLVIGDDRDQSLEQRARFRHAGLSHLQAVSGQNVVFVLAAVAPLARRIPGRARTGFLLVVLGVFLVATRAEPSVVRAVAAAGLSVVAVSTGRRASGLQVLGLAVAGVVLIDPFLVDAVGFRLSVAASLGILLLGPSLVARIRGPRWWAEGVGITASAQLGVLSLMLSTFGPVSVVGLPANVAAGWAAGLVMVWGLSGGLLAVMVPPAVGGLVQWPVAALTAWIDGVATWASRLALPVVGGRAVIVGVVAVGMLWWVSARGRRLARWWLLAGSVLLAGYVVVADAGLLVGSGPQILAGGEWWPSRDPQAASVLVVGADARGDLVEEVVVNTIDGVDVLVVVSGAGFQRDVVEALVRVVGPSVVLAPDRHRIPGARRLAAPLVVAVADGRSLRIDPGERRLVVRELGP